MLEVLSLVAVLVLLAVALALYGRRGRPVEPAPLESGHAREAVRAAIERRERG